MTMHPESAMVSPSCVARSMKGAGMSPPAPPMTPILSRISPMPKPRPSSLQPRIIGVDADQTAIVWMQGERVFFARTKDLPKNLRPTNSSTERLRAL